MIRTTMTATMTKVTTMLAVGLLALSSASAMAAPLATHHRAKAAVVAQAEGAAPAGDAAKPAKKSKGKKAKASKDGTDKMKEKAPATETAAPTPTSDKK